MVFRLCPPRAGTLLFLFVILLAVLYPISCRILSLNEETPLSILVETLWWKNNLGRGIDRVLNQGKQAGLSLDIQNEQGWCPLMFAVEFNVTKSVELLLQNGADPLIAERDQWTPLHFAGFHGNKEIIDMLLKYNADASALNKDGRMPYQLAWNRGFANEARMLSRHAFSKAVEQEDVKKMLSCIQDFPEDNPVNAIVGPMMMTPLSLAVKRRNLPVIQALLAIGAAPSYADARVGLTPLHHAVRLGEIGIVQHLLEFSSRMKSEGRAGSVDVNSASNDGKSSLDLAVLLLSEASSAQSNIELESVESSDATDGENRANTRQRREIVVMLQKYAGQATLDDIEIDQVKTRRTEELKKKAQEKSFFKSFLAP